MVFLPALLTSTKNFSSFSLLIFQFQTGAAKNNKDSALAFTNELLGTTFTDIKENGITESEMVKYFQLDFTDFSIGNLKESLSTHLKI